MEKKTPFRKDLVIKEDFKTSILQWRYQKKYNKHLDRWQEKIINNDNEKD